MAQTSASSDAAIQRFLQSMASPDPVVRQAAAAFARRRGAPAVSGLADLMASDDKAVAKAAKMALEEITHHAARPGASAEARAVSGELLKIALSNRSREVRAHALYLLGFVADARVAPEIAWLRQDREIGEDARMALERIQQAAGGRRR